MSDKKPQDTSPESQDDEEIAEAAARLSAKWALASQTARTDEVKSQMDGAEPAPPRKTTTSGPILQTLEKGRTHMVTVEVKRRRGKRSNGSNGSNGQDK